MLLSVILIPAIAMTIYLAYKNRNKEEAIFKKTLQEFQMPVCIINNVSQITWHNKFFQEQFGPFIGCDFEEVFEPKKILHQIQITYNKHAWIIKHTNLNSSFGITFQALKKETLDWWNILPFPVGIIHEDVITNMNYSMQCILGEEIDMDITNLASQFNEKKASQPEGQGLIWKTKFGVLPILTWIKDYGDEKILILENRAEFIRLKNKAQEAQHLQIMGQLACSIIHDFNNLLTAISGFSELLENTLPENEMLLEIQRNTEQASNLAQELLNFVRDKPHEQKATNVSKFLLARKTMLQKLLGPHINLTIGAEHDGLIDISETQLEQIILNMSLNSKDAMHNHGNLTITLRKKYFPNNLIIKNTQLEPGNYFMIEITDTGSGIPTEHINKIFSPFFSTKSKGTGLGLASCMRIIQHASGMIDLKTSKLGTTFTIYLPVSKQMQPIIELNAVKNTLKNKHPREKVIVLAEDEEVIRTLMKQALIQEGYVIHSYANGVDAFEAIKKFKVDALITDAILPGVDGIQLAKNTKEFNPNIKILVVSGYSIGDLSPNVDGQVNYLPKPFTLKTLKEKTLELFD